MIRSRTPVYGSTVRSNTCGRRILVRAFAASEGNEHVAGRGHAQSNQNVEQYIPAVTEAKAAAPLAVQTFFVRFHLLS